MSDKPLVSIIVPVYNSGRFLRRCLDSLVYQTLENIEIICINNGSEDDSLGILNEYKELFPDKLFVYTIEHHPRAGHGRNVGMHYARADYIAFCDSDDMMHLKALEWMYKEAISAQCDLVVAPHWRVEDRNFLIGGRIPHTNNITVEDLVLSASPSVWAKLIHKSLIKNVGDMPESISAEDIPYSFMLHTYAQKIGYIDNAIYYYINRSDSEVRSFLSTKKIENIPAQDYGYEHGNPEYRYAIEAKNGCWAHNFIKRDWVFADVFIERGKQLWPSLSENEFFKEHYKYDFENLKKFVSLSDTPMDTIVYAADFEHRMTKERKAMIAEKAFFKDAQLTVLDETNCDINENQYVAEAYKNGDYEFVGKYFALKRIYQTSGIFIGNRVKIDAPLNYIRYFPAFFGYLDEKNFTDEVFGGLKASKVLGKILDTYENGGKYKDKFLPLADRMRNILYAVYQVPLSGAKTTLFKYEDFAVFSPDIFVCDISDGMGALFPKLHFTTLDFSDKLSSEEKNDYVVIKYTTLRSIRNNLLSSKATPANNAKIKELSDKVHEYETSDSWLITAPLRKFSRTKVGSVFLRVYRKLIKLKKVCR